MKTLAVFLALLPLGLISYAHAQETSHLQFVSQYIQQLGTIEHLRAVAEKELKEGDGSQLASCIRNCTRYELELKAQIGMLKTMSLNPPFEDLPTNILTFNEQKLKLYQKMSDICSTLIAGPKAGVDYGSLAAEMPKIRAQLDRSLRKILPLSAFY